MLDSAVPLLLAVVALIGLGASVWLIFGFLDHVLMSITHRSPPLTVQEILLWASEVGNAGGQLQKAYDWEIAQWSSFATAVIAATLGFLSAGAIEVIKKPEMLWSIEHASLVGVGVILSLFLYLHAHQKIARLRREFLQIYSLLLLLK